MQASYLITYREDATQHRRRNLETILAWLSAQPIRAELQVIVVEQSQTPSLYREADELFRDVTLVHAFNPAEFNKSWGLNIAARYASTPWLIFADADMMLPSGLEESLDMLARGVEVVKPYARLIDLDERETLALDDGELPSVLSEPDAGAQARAHAGEHVVLAGGIFAVQSRVFARMGGFDERFLGWGGEDDAMTFKIQRMRPSTVQLDALALHLFHPRNRPTLQAQPSYATNVALLEQYRALPEPTLLRLFEIQKQMAGNPNKYSPQRLDTVDVVVTDGARK